MRVDGIDKDFPDDAVIVRTNDRAVKEVRSAKGGVLWERSWQSDGYGTGKSTSLSYEEIIVSTNVKEGKAKAIIAIIPVPGLGVHPDVRIEVNAWTVTHLNTGWFIVDRCTKARALSIARELGKHLDWTLIHTPADWDAWRTNHGAIAAEMARIISQK
jgi:hypothetical protein